jgi:hypothetical protein
MNKNSGKSLQELEGLASLTKAKGFRELDVVSMVRGIGRNATDGELIEYLSMDQDAEPINIKTAFSKYARR